MSRLDRAPDCAGAEPSSSGIVDREGWSPARCAAIPTTTVLGCVWTNMILRRTLLLALGAASLRACTNVQSEPKLSAATDPAVAYTGERPVSAVDDPNPQPSSRDRP